MNDCGHIREKLSAYIDGELPARENGHIQRHLHQCPACQKEESSLRRLSALLDEVVDEVASPAFTSNAVYRAAAWGRCAYVKGHLIKPAAAYGLSLLSLVLHLGSVRRRYPMYRYLRNFDDFPPESLSCVYVALIEGECR